MIAANKPEDQVVIYTIHESDRGQKVRWLLEVMAVPYEVVLMNRQAMPEQYAEISLNVFHYRDPDCGIRGIHVIRGIHGIPLTPRLPFSFVFIGLPVAKGLLLNDLCDGRHGR